MFLDAETILEPLQSPTGPGARDEQQPLGLVLDIGSISRLMIMALTHQVWKPLAA